ncbi:MAG: DUF6020 family protein [Oscillospiraceae bacterium]|nr:DUF6020 family protein [Oscillospiraceae bacterium]
MKKNIITSLISIAILCGINFFLFPLADKLTEAYGVNVFGINSFLNIFLLIVIWKAVDKMPKLAGRAKSFAIWIAAFLALSQTIGNILIKRYSLVIWNWEFLVYSLMLAGLFLLFYLILTHVFHYIDNHKYKEEEENRWWFFTDNARSFWLITLVLFLCYLPFFLSFWPGFVSVDFKGGPTRHIDQITSGNYNTWLPILYTFFIEFFYRLGKIYEFNYLPAFEITQILLWCLTFSYLIHFLARIKVARWQRIMVFIFIALNPFLHIFAPMPAKDVMFTLVSVLLFIETCKLANATGEYLSKVWNMAKLIGLLFLFAALRSNAHIAFFVSIPFLLFALRHYWKRISVVLISVIILLQALSFFQYNILNAGRALDADALSPILQQMRKVYFSEKEKLTEEDIELLDEIFHLDYTTFSHTNNDFSKLKISFKKDVFDENPMRYMLLWAKLGIRFPLQYTASFLNTNLSLWYLDAPTPRYNWSGQGYLMMEPSANVTVWSLLGDTKKLPLNFIAKAYIHLNRNIVASNIPIISFLTSYSFAIMTMLLIMVLMIYKRSKVYVAFIPLIVYLATCFFAPVVYARYLMPYVVLAIPSIVIFLQILKQKDNL